MSPIPIRLRLVIAAGTLCLTATGPRAAASPPSAGPTAFYTVTGEIALARQEPRVAALQYAAGAQRDPGLLPRAAEVAADSLQPTIGLALAERWVRLQPQSADARLAAAGFALALHRVDQAAAQYRALVSLAADGVEAALGRVAAVLLEAPNRYGARQVADRLAAAYPGSAAALRLQGLAALDADDPASAVRALRAALAAGVADAQARSLVQALRRARVLSGDAAAPLAETEAELTPEPTDEQRFDYALLLLAADRHEAARDQLASLLAHPDAASQALRLLVVIEYEDGDDAAASGHLAQLVALGQMADDAYYYEGLIAERHADVDRALGCYARVRGGDNGLAAMLHAGKLLRTHGEVDEANALFDQLVVEQPRAAPDIVAARAELEREAGNGAGAAQRLAAGLQQYPDSIELRYARATLLEESGDVDASLRELAAILKARPQDPAAANALGFTLADHARELPRARALIDAAIAAAPHSAAIRDSLGWVLFRQGKPREALPILASAFADEPGGDIGAHLGEVQWMLGQRDEAERTWARAGTIDLDNRLLKATRQRLRQQRAAQ